MDANQLNLLLQKIKNNTVKAKDGKWIQDVTKEMEKKGTKGKFAEWCGGKVTMACIERGLKSKNPKIRKRAQLAKAFMSMRKKEDGGETYISTSDYVNELKNMFVSKLRDNNAINMLHDVAQKQLDLEDAMADYYNSINVINELSNELYGGSIFEDGGETMNEETSEYNISYEDFVRFIESYPDYLQRYLNQNK